MSNSNETLAEIVAEMRKRMKSHYYSREGRNLMRQYADRIGAAAKRERGIYVGETYAGHETEVNMYDVLGYDGDGCRIRSMTNKDAVDRIDNSLRELGLLPPQGDYQFVVSPREEDKPFYETYAEAIQYLKERIMSSKDKWENMDLLNRMGLGKWVSSAKLEGGAKIRRQKSREDSPRKKNAKRRKCLNGKSARSTNALKKKFDTSRGEEGGES